MHTAAVLYVGDLPRMRDFYQRCFSMSPTDSGDGFCGLSVGTWMLTLVETPHAMPDEVPAPRRSDTPIKLAFEVAGLAAARATITELGGRVEPEDTEWHFRDAMHCDCIDPEGNVVQLIQFDQP